MAKDYFQDVLPPSGSGATMKSAPPMPPPPRPAPPPPVGPGLDEVDEEEPVDTEPTPTRSIRNIPVSPRTRRSFADREGPPPPKPPRRLLPPRLFLWLIAGLSILVLGTLFLVAMRPTSVVVTPRTQQVVFDASAEFVAYPAIDAGLGSLSYTVETTDIEDSAVVKGTGTERVEERTKGTLTVVNNYSTDPVRLIANTRFATPEGLVFRTPIAVVVPGKRGATPGELKVNVVADEAGEKYNVGPVSRFTLPGLQSTPDMFSAMSAYSTEAMTGGFVGERPTAPKENVEAARAEIRSRLETQARSAAAERNTGDTIVLSDLIRITYTSLPNTEEAEGSVRVRESARVEMPVFPAVLFARTAARGVSAEAETSDILVENLSSLTAKSTGTDTNLLGASPVRFSLEGSAQIVWQVDSADIQQALAGKGEDAFETIIATFPGIEEARARVQPFWKSSFPTDPAAIEVRIEKPSNQ